MFRTNLQRLARGAGALLALGAATGPATLPARAAAASPPPLTVRGTDQGVWVYQGGNFANYGGQVLARPVAVSSGGYNLYIATGMDHDLWARDDTHAWRSLSAAPVYCLEGPAATVVGGTLHVGCTGGDGSLWTASTSLSPGVIPVLQDWGGRGGKLLTGATSAATGANPQFLGIGGDGHVWSWSLAAGWSQQALQCFSHPDAGGDSGFAVIACRGLDNAMWYSTSSGSGWSSPQPGRGMLGETLAARPVNGGLVVDVAAPDGTIWENPVSGGGAGGWGGLPGRVAMSPAVAYANDGIPFYPQVMPLDCETASMQMGLAYYGNHYSQQDLFNLEGNDLRRAYWDGNNVLHWGDPYGAFVGNVYGAEGNYTGYGVYYPPIVSIAHSHGLPGTTGGEALAPVTIYNAIAEGRPVEAWVEYHWARPTVGQWIAFDGRPISYTTWEHTVTLTAVTADAVRVNDPASGGPYWVSRGAFEASWHDFDNMAVIFR